MDRGNFILGDEVAGLEAEWATFTGVKHCIELRTAQTPLHFLCVHWALARVMK